MSALARYFYSFGALISGSDKETSKLITDLKSEGIKNIWTPHSTEQLKEINPDYVVYSTAITQKNEEILWAKENKKTILHRAELLDLVTQSKKLISVSGTHGKTTTTAMISEILMNSNIDPSIILGGILLSKNTNAISGNGDYFVIEADESDRSHLKGNPEIGVITNIESDHLENYDGNFEGIKESFLAFSKKAISNNGLVACFDDKVTRELITKNFDLNNPKLISYSLNPSDKESKVYAVKNLKTNSWEIYLNKAFTFSMKLKPPGRHNILNALAAFCVCNLLGLNLENIKKSLEDYKGVKRRFQFLGEINNITFIDDYAHHPTEIAATLSSAKELNPNRLIAILQPHQPARLKDLWDEFLEVLKHEDCLIFVTDTYLARGAEIEGISSKKLTEEVNKPNIQYLPGNIEQIANYIEKLIKPKDLILIMGAGDITNLGPILLKSHKILVSNTGNN